MTRCVFCLSETPLTVYLANDMLCDPCNEEPPAFPLRTTSPPPWERIEPEGKRRGVAIVCQEHATTAIYEAVKAGDMIPRCCDHAAITWLAEPQVESRHVMTIEELEAENG